MVRATIQVEDKVIIQALVMGTIQVVDKATIQVDQLVQETNAVAWTLKTAALVARNVSTTMNRLTDRHAFLEQLLISFWRQVCENVRQDRCQVHHTEFCKASSPRNCKFNRAHRKNMLL